MSFIPHAIHLFQEILPVFLAAVIASSLIDKFLPDDYLDKIFSSQNEFLGILNASFLGSLIPICTCGMIPLAMKLYQKGLNWKLLTAFLVAGNACSIPALMLTTVLGYKITAIRLITSIIFGVLVTYVLTIICPKDFKLEIKISSCGHSGEKTKSSIAKEIFNDIISMCKSFLPWIAVAVIIASLLSSQADSGDLAKYIHMINNDLFTPFFASLIGFPFYFCAGADVPISLELLNLGLPIGTVISFMLASPGVNLTSLFVYKQAIGFRQALTLTGVSILTAVIIGIICNIIF